MKTTSAGPRPAPLVIPDATLRSLLRQVWLRQRTPALILAADAALVDANRAARRLLGVRGQLRYQRGCVWPSDVPRARWRSALASALSSAGRDTPPLVVHSTAQPAGGGLRLYTVTAVSEAQVCAVQVIDATLRDAPPVGRIRAAFGLTNAQAAAARGVSRGLRPAALAACMGIAVETARSHVKAAQARLGVRTQAHLVARVLALLPE